VLGTLDTRGIKLANKCLLMAAIAYNLKKMLKFKTRNANAAMAWITTPSEQNMNLYFSFC
jgi:hypothetical protein